MIRLSHDPSLTEALRSIRTGFSDLEAILERPATSENTWHLWRALAALSVQTSQLADKAAKKTDQEQGR